jgi:hypothetical protein
MAVQYVTWSSFVCETGIVFPDSNVLSCGLNLNLYVFSLLKTQTFWILLYNYGIAFVKRNLKVSQTLTISLNSLRVIHLRFCKVMGICCIYEMCFWNCHSCFAFQIRTSIGPVFDNSKPICFSFIMMGDKSSINIVTLFCAGLPLRSAMATTISYFSLLQTA